MGIHAEMYCTFQKQMVAKNNLYESKIVLLKFKSTKSKYI